jgi:hypothetical protein
MAWKSTSKKSKTAVAAPVWTPFQQAWLSPETVELVSKTHRAKLASCWKNDLYEVWIFEWAAEDNPIGCPMTQLSIKRRDRGVARSWRDLQRIKNELCGREREAVELFPSDKRLMDSANQYHLWVLPEGQLYPFGYWDRIVSEISEHGAVQEPFPADDRPADLDAMEAKLRDAQAQLDADEEKNTSMSISCSK